MGSEAQKSLPTLIDILNNTDENNELRRTVAKTIGSIAKEHQVVDVNNNNIAKVLIEKAKTDSDEFVRVNAAEALSKIAPYTSNSQQELIELLKNENENIRVSAAVGISNIAISLQDKYQNQNQKDTDGLSQAITDLDNSIKEMKPISKSYWKEEDKQKQFQKQEDIITRKLDLFKERKSEEFW